MPNDLVFREGDVGKEMYFLVQGLMEVVVKIGTAEETTYGQIEEGDYFGEIAVFELVRRTASVRAIQYSTTFVLTSESLDNVTHCTYRRSFVATTLLLLIGFCSPSACRAFVRSLTNAFLPLLCRIMPQIIPPWRRKSGQTSRQELRPLCRTTKRAARKLDQQRPRCCCRQKHRKLSPLPCRSDFRWTRGPRLTARGLPAVHRQS